jgi:hypothetical protein
MLLEWEPLQYHHHYFETLEQIVKEPIVPVVYSVLAITAIIAIAAAPFLVINHYFLEVNYSLEVTCLQVQSVRLIAH